MKAPGLLLIVGLLSANVFAAGLVAPFRVYNGAYRASDQPLIDDGVFRPCSCHNSPFESIQDLVTRVNIIGTRADGSLDDGRDNITVNRRELKLPSADSTGLSAEEVARIRAVTGYVMCQDAAGNIISSGSGALVENNMTIITAAHVFSVNGGTALPANSKCFFQNQEDSYKRVDLVLDGSEVLGMRGPSNGTDPNDYAVVRLKAPITSPNAIPFPIQSRPVAANTRFMAVSSYQDVPNRTLDPAIPVAQVATAIQPNASRGGASPSDYYTDADLQPASSGGATLVRENGQLMYFGIVVGTGKPVLNGRPFSLSEGSLSRVIGINGGFLDAVVRLRDSTPQVEGLLSTSSPVQSR